MGTEEEKNQPTYQQVRLSTEHYNDLVISNAEGKEPYVFVSYKSQDFQQVFSIMAEMQKRYGLRVYYDKAFDQNNDYWVKQMLGNLSYPVCAVVLCFISESYLSSYATLIELMHSQVGDDYGESIKAIPIFLEPLPLGNGGDFKAYDSKLALESSNTGLPSDGPERTVFNELFEKMVLRLEEIQDEYDKNSQTLAGCLKQLKTLEKGAAPVIDTRFTYRLFKEIFNSLHCNQFHLHNYEMNMDQFYQDFQGKIRSASGDFSPFGEIPVKVEEVPVIPEIAEEVVEITETVEEVPEPVEEVPEIQETAEEVTETVEEVSEEVAEIQEIEKTVEEVTETVEEVPEEVEETPEEVPEIQEIEKTVEKVPEIQETVEEDDEDDEFSRELDALVAAMDESLKGDDFWDRLSHPDSERLQARRGKVPEPEPEVIYQELEPSEYKAEGGVLVSVETTKAYIILPKEITSIKAVVEHKVQIQGMPEKFRQKIWVTAFTESKELRGVDASRGVTVLGEGAFWGSSRLKEVILSEGVTNLPENLFKDCSKLERVDIPTTVGEFGEKVFYGCESLKEAVIPQGVKCLPSGLFERCTSLEKVTIPTSVANIKRRVFCNCKGLKEVTLPEGLQELEEELFAKCTSLEKMVIPTSVRKLGDSSNGVFFQCSGLKEVVIPEGVAKLPKKTFANCTSLERVVLPSTLGNISEECFQNCSKLKSVTLPKKVDIKSSAFDGCDKKFLKDSGISKRIRQKWLGI